MLFQNKNRHVNTIIKLEQKISTLEKDLYELNIEFNKLEETSDDKDFEIKELKTIVSNSSNCINCRGNTRKNVLNKFVKKIESKNISRIDQVCNKWKSISSIHNLDLNDYELPRYRVTKKD